MTIIIQNNNIQINKILPLIFKYYNGKFAIICKKHRVSRKPILYKRN